MNNYVITCCSTADMPASYFEEKRFLMPAFISFLTERNIRMIWGNQFLFQTFIG